MISIYEYRDYKTYLQARSQEHGLRSGFKSGMAKACGCNNAYISSVLGGKANLSLEQADAVSAYLNLSREEAHYFLLLIQRARSGTVSLRSYFDSQIDQLLDEKLHVQRRLGGKEQLTKEDQSKYYSSWMYAAVHVALSVPRLGRSSEALAAYFDLPLTTIHNVLEFLESAGLAVRERGGYTIGPRHIHLGNDSENIQRHHYNWRLHAIRSFERETDQNLNYSSAVTLSREDAYKVREILLSAIKNSVDLIIASPEEDVFALTVDFMSLGNTPTNSRR